MRDLAVHERLRHHPYGLTAGGEDRVRDHAHKANAPAAVDQRRAPFGERSAEPPGAGLVGGTPVWP